MAPTLLRGLSILGPGECPGPDLALEMGLSAWMFRHGTDLYGVRGILPALRAAVLESAGMDPAHEPVPLVGRSPRDDVLRSVAYLGELLERAALVTGATPDDVAERAIARLDARCVPGRLVADDGDDDEVVEMGRIIPLR